MKLGTTIATKQRLDLDVDTLVATRLLVTATSGGGKSWALRRILEETHGDIQQIVLDPEGEFSSLRERGDYVLAGKGGDVAARPETAAKLAEHLLELGVSAVCDLYELKASERKRFVRLFLEAMINAPKRLWHPVLVVIDEAHLYCPEKGQAESAEAVIDLCTRGRKRGFCAVLATQRVSNLDKQAAAQCTNVMVGPTFQDVDRRRGVEILGAESRADERELKAGLMRLKPGEFWALGRAFSEHARTLVKVGAVKTHHPEIAGGRKAIPGPPPPSAKVKGILAKLEDIPREAEEEARELVRLRRRVRELECQLREAKAQPGTTEDRERIGELEQELETLRGVAQAAFDVTVRDRQAFARIREVIAVALSEEEPPPLVTQKTAGKAAPQRASRTPSRGHNGRRVISAGNVDTDVDPDYRPRAGARRMLDVLARYPGVMTASQLRTMARLRKSGTSDTYLSELVRNGLIERNGDEVRITERGLEMIGATVKPMITPAEVLDAWRQCFRAGARRMLDSLVEDAGRGMTRDELGAATELEPTSGTFGTYLGELKRNGLAVEDGGLVRLAEFLREAV
ncbi:MAG: DUF87 domain-containing protein [Armatimonadetes bacterium]|nr:DUF87 domain-containing protein [Armatimonadota bacterium]